MKYVIAYSTNSNLQKMNCLFAKMALFFHFFAMFVLVTYKTYLKQLFKYFYCIELPYIFVTTLEKMNTFCYIAITVNVFSIWVFSLIISNNIDVYCCCFYLFNIILLNNIAKSHQFPYK